MFVVALVPLSCSCVRILCVLLSAICKLWLFIRTKKSLKYNKINVYLQINEKFALLSGHKCVERIKHEYTGIPLSYQRTELR